MCFYIFLPTLSEIDFKMVSTVGALDCSGLESMLHKAMKWSERAMESGTEYSRSSTMLIYSISFHYNIDEML